MRMRKINRWIRVEDELKAGLASVIEGIITNYLIYVLFTMLGILSRAPPFAELMNTNFVIYLIIIIIMTLLIEEIMNFINAIMSIGYAVGLVIGGFVVFFSLGEETNIIIGICSLLLRLVIEILKHIR